MGRTAEVESFERVTDEDGAEIDQVQVDPGGDASTTVEHFSNAGDDAPPLPGDFAALEDSTGTGNEHATGYLDPKNKGKAGPGEKRIYARDASGKVVAEIWLKGSGSITIENGGGAVTIDAGGTITLNGVEIDKLGNLTAPGQVMAMALVPAAAVKLSTHMHPTAAPGGPSPPVPGS